ncbi:peptidylprolyl isomerase [Prevotella intermedia ATCC 25611 = DSM 20706]|uniref:peptidylprolyl isomerase n=1 Tax=Prevotella intermedia TaxID=28131 RepID=UPI00048B3778|nr:peptidylprolyl isomerase [Prevotella intermedia]APW31697.1 peptidylprolyl isomerase [Prevotella intermedia ATCC 25611 = DSM 20706]SUB96225.1 Foldase protein prsA precursor [Prevotella intermedia]
MRIIAFFAAALLSSTMVFAQQNDPVIMTVNGQPINRSEFEYSYNKNNTEGVIDKKSVEEYVDLFINYKLKVQAALDAKLDTLTSFKQEFMTYRDQQVRPSMITDADVEAEARKIYKETRDRIENSGGLVRCAHILLALKQKATDSEQTAIANRADSIYNVLKKGGNFAELAKKYSSDPGSAARGGELPLITKGQTVQSFETALFSMKPGEISHPVLSPFGYHIIKYIEKEEFQPYDSLKADIYHFIEARNLREQIIDQKLKDMAVEAGNGVTPQQLVEKRLAEMEAKDANLKHLIREYHDGLLLIEMSTRTIWDKAAADEEGLQSFFKKNKKNYAWKEPRFKGIAYHVQNQGDVKAVKNCIAKVPFKEWGKTLRTTFNNDSTIRVRVEKGLFKAGDNALVDREIFKQKTEVKPVKDYPIDAVYGKKLKAPEELDDVRSQVVSDYQEVLEKEWVKDLRKKYAVTVNREVLATVNKH